jgi:hypothetical protein
MASRDNSLAGKKPGEHLGCGHGKTHHDASGFLPRFPHTGAQSDGQLLATGGDYTTSCGCPHGTRATDTERARERQSSGSFSREVWAPPRRDSQTLPRQTPIATRRSGKRALDGSGSPLPTKFLVADTQFWHQECGTQSRCQALPTAGDTVVKLRDTSTGRENTRSRDMPTKSAPLFSVRRPILAQAALTRPRGFGQRTTGRNTSPCAVKPTPSPTCLPAQTARACEPRARTKPRRSGMR